MRAAKIVTLCGATVLAGRIPNAHAQIGPVVPGPDPFVPPAVSGGSPSSLANDRRDPVKNYKLGPQDVLSISVERQDKMGAPSVVVPPDGKIALSYFGTHYVTGKTTSQVEKELTKSLAKRLKKPVVSVSLIRLRPASEGVVYVIGNVRTPGSVDITSGYRLTEILSRVGGLLGRADEASATLARVGKPLMKLDLHAAISKPLSPANVRVKPNDFITIQAEDFGRVAINGDITRPGPYELRRAPRAAFYELPMRARVSDAIVAAGGIASAASSSSGTAAGLITGYIQRGPNTIDLRMKDILEASDPSANIPLEPGDFLTVKVKPPLTVFVTGLVRAPGAIEVRQGSDLLQALAQTGGLTQPLDRVTATLQRGPNKNPVDLAKVLSGDTEANIKLEDRDVLQIEEPAYLNVKVAGRVGKASTDEYFHLPRNATLMDAIAQAGGLEIDPDKASISILRRLPGGDQKFLNIDPVALFTARDQSQNARLAEGDLVTVSEEKRRQVIVSGEVLRPGPIEIREGLSVADAIAQAGGHKPTAALTQVKVQRAGRTVVVDALDAVESGKPIPGEFGTVQDEDSIIVPENKNYVFVWEAVNKPGRAILPEREHFTILDAIGAAGGYKPNAKTKEVVLWREVAQGQMKPTIISLRELKEGKNLAIANQPLQPNDLIVVPEGTLKQSPINQASQAFGLLSLLRAF